MTGLLWSLVGTGLLEDLALQLAHTLLYLTAWTHRPHHP
jgi:hypothetical protein